MLPSGPGYPWVCQRPHFSEGIPYCLMAIKLHFSFWKPSLRGILSNEVSSANVYLSGKDKKPWAQPHPRHFKLLWTLTTLPAPILLSLFSHKYVWKMMTVVLDIYWGPCTCQAIYLTLIHFHHWVLTTTWWGRYFHFPHFADEKIEARRDSVIWSKSSSKQVAEADCKFSPCDDKVCSFFCLLPRYSRAQGAYLSFFFFFSMPPGMWGVSSPMRDWTCAPSIGCVYSYPLNLREFPSLLFKVQADLRDITGSVPDLCEKSNTAVKQVTWVSGFPLTYEGYVYTIL